MQSALYIGYIDPITRSKELCQIQKKIHKVFLNPYYYSFWIFICLLIFLKSPKLEHLAQKCPGLSGQFPHSVNGSSLSWNCRIPSTHVDNVVISDVKKVLRIFPFWDFREIGNPGLDRSRRPTHRGWHSRSQRSNSFRRFSSLGWAMFYLFLHR